MIIHEIMTKRVKSIDSDELVIDACRKFKENKLGSLIVKEQDIIVGIITERDVIDKIILDKKSPNFTKVKDIMTPNLKTINSLQTVEEAVKIMTKNNIKKLPVTYNNIIVGIITEKDITRAIEMMDKNE